MSGSAERRALRGGSLVSKAFKVFVSFSLAIGLMPSIALASENSAVDAAPSDVVLNDGSLQDGGVQPADESNGTQSQDSTDANANSDAVVPDADGEEKLEPVTAPSAQSVEPAIESVNSASDGAEEGGSVARSLDESAFLLIQSEKDQDSMYSYASGTVSAGTVLWANMYEPSGYYGADCVPAENGWQYQWLCSSEKSNDADDYEHVEGQTGQSLVVDDSLAGKYIAVQVTVDGAIHYGPRTSSTSSSMDFNVNYLPGPVLKKGQAELYSVKLSSSSPAVGDTLVATAYTSFSAPAGDDVEVSYTWQQGDSRYGSFTDIEGVGTGNSLTLTEAQQGKYIKVIANAGVNEEEAVTSDAVMAEGAVKLAGVQVDEPASLQMPVSLTAKAYTGSSYSPTYIDEGVTYTWKYAMKDPSSSYGIEWTVVAGENGATLTVDGDQYAGAYFSVEANAGVNTVKLSDYSAIGPMKLKGQVDISAVSIYNEKDGTSVFVVGDTATARVREVGAPSGQYVDANLLNFQWQVAESKNGDYADITGANGSELVIDDSLAGKYLRCVVSSKVGQSTYTGRVNLPVGEQGSINVTSVKLDKSGKVNVGDTITATASAAQGDVTANGQIRWAWYCGDSQYSVDSKIEGADGNTLEVTKDLLGKYIEARANGGFGEQASSAIGPAVVPGAVELYRVETVGEAKIGSTVSAKAYKNSYSTAVDAADVVSYQWQYAESSTTLDSAFSDIPGATQADYTIPETIDGKSAQGLYLRVRATSDGTVVSTYQKSYSSSYPSEYVDPLGPIALEGQYTLAGVELESTGQGMQAGNTIAPTAMVKEGYYETEVPDDAKLTFTWYVSDTEDGEYAEMGSSAYDSTTGDLLLDDALVGKFVKVQAYALDNTVESDAYQVLPKDVYELLRVTTSPAINGSSTLITGDKVEAAVQAKRISGSTYGDDVTEKVSIQWYVGDAEQGTFVPLESADSAQITVPAEAAGKYLKVVATSGSFKVEQVSASPVLDGNSVAGAAAQLDSLNWRPSPAYGIDGNLNEVVEAKLAELGYEGVSVATVEATTSTSLPVAAEVGVSTTEGEGNGEITYFYVDPDEITGYANYSSWTQVRCSFSLSRDGESVEWAPSASVSIPWDEDRVASLLQQKAEHLEIGLAEGDSLDSVTGDLVLPYKLSDVSGEMKSWSEIEWSSSNDEAIAISGYGWDDYEGMVVRTAADQQVSLTATIGIVTSGGPGTTIDKTFEVVVKGDPQKVESEKAELQKKVDAAFDASKLSYSEDGSAVDPQAVMGDIQLPRTGTLGIDGKYYSIEYSSSNDAIVVNGYRGNVYQPLPTQRAGKSVDLTIAVTSKENEQISAEKTISLVVAPLEAEDIQSELSLMEKAKEGYAAALLNGQDAKNVTANLSTFQKAYLDEKGDIAWARDLSSASAAGNGIVTEDLEPDDDMGVVPGHWFKSSNADVVAHDTLLVAQPEYNTQVTVNSALSSEKYARYAERYADDPIWGETFSQLANQAVSTTFTVAGTTGIDDPTAGQEPEDLSVGVKITGIAAEKQDGVAVAETWIPLTEVTVASDAGAKAWDVFAQVLDAAGYSYSLEGYYCPYSITSPEGAVLEASSSAPWSYWSFLINGEYAQVGADQYEVEDGDVIELVYVDGSGVTQPEGDVELNPDAEHPDLEAQWNGFANGGSGSSLQGVVTATEGADLKWQSSLLTDEEREAGASCASSDPLIIDGRLYVVSGSSVYDAANNWAETKSLARLQVIDPATGKVERQVTLARGMDSLCRMVYADGIIVVPLAGGYLQAVSASTLETIWVVDAIEGAQSVSSLTVSDGYVYVATLDGMDASWMGTSGTVRRVNLHTGALAGSIASDSTGYYWAGGIVVDGCYLVGDDAGTVSAYGAELASGEPLARCELGAPVRSTLVESDGFIYAVTNDGVIHKLRFADGVLSEVGTGVKFAASSTSTPAIVEGKAYVGGAEADYTGVLAVIDLASMKLDVAIGSFSSATADGKELPADVKSAPLVSVQDGEVYVYFTCNNLPGALYCYKQGGAEATMLFLPESAAQNYSMSSAFAGSDGTLYFINDSGNLFALAPGTSLPAWGEEEDGQEGSGDNGESGDGGPSHEGEGSDPAVRPGDESGNIKGSGSSPLILTHGPSTQSADGQEGEGSDDAASSDDPSSSAEGSAAQASARTLSGDVESVEGALQESGIPSWLPIAGIIVGACGLIIAAAFTVSLARKRSNR